MSKYLLLPILAAATVIAAAVPPAYALAGINGVMLNGVALNGRGLNGTDPIGETAFHAVRLTLPDGTALTFH